LLKEIEAKIIEKLKSEIPELKTVKGYDGDLLDAKISRLPVLAPFVFVIYTGRKKDFEGTEVLDLLRFRLIIGNTGYDKEKARYRTMDVLEKIEEVMRNFEIFEYQIEPFRMTEEGLFYTDDKFSIYYQDYESYKF